MITCCDEMVRAHQAGTDNEGYEPLARFVNDGTYMGDCSELKAIRFCPWCGKRVESEAEKAEPDGQ